MTEKTTTRCADDFAEDAKALSDSLAERDFSRAEVMMLLCALIQAGEL